MQPEQKLQHHMDSEDQRVKELTECVLYDFLPAALNVMLPRAEDSAAELDADKCRVSSGAAAYCSRLSEAPLLKPLTHLQHQSVFRVSSCHVASSRFTPGAADIAGVG